MFDTPILFLIFNRPDTTKRVFERIREVKPRQLFIAADGPRKGNEIDLINCRAARDIVNNVDWDCEVETLFRDANLGCGKALSGAITWFFKNVEEGIILEDDTLPDSSFFTFCRDLLEYYRTSNQILVISGNNFQEGKIRGNASYYFSRYPHIWGWATWRRAWRFYQVNCKDLNEFILSPLFKEVTNSRKERRYWQQLFMKVENEEVDTWDYSWLYTVWSHNGITILPNFNLVENIGFGINATHTFGSNVDYKKNILGSISDIIHPNKIIVNRQADMFTFKTYFSSKVSLKNKLRNLAYKVIPDGYYKKLKQFFGRS
ncbi:MAG: nucleotide-diphospho-sugar transferase [Bacteroidota bacterium]|nr:nucleotide-diphospho-sugar transferase [Bacteroidota bacterium]